MIPKVTQDDPFIGPQYFCSVCSAPLKKTDPITGEPTGWKFCSICGSPIEWEKAGPPIMTEFTVLVTFEDGSSITDPVVGAKYIVELKYPVGKTLRRGRSRGKTIANVEIISVREFTREDSHDEP